MRTTAFWTLYVGITILIGSVCHYHTGVEGRPGKSPAGKTVVTGGRERNRKKGGLKVRRKMTASEKLRADEKLDSFDSDNQYTEEDEGKF